MKKIRVIPLLALVTLIGSVIGCLAALLFGEAILLLGSVGAVVGLTAGFSTIWLRRPRHFRPHWTAPLLKTELEPLPQPITSLFLYTTLHNIAALMLFDAPKAGEILEHFANLVRTTAELNKRRQTYLGEEFKAIDLYLTIEKARLDDRMVIVRDFSPSCLEVPFPSLALFPLVIDCVRYGVETQMNPVTVTVSCRLENQNVTIEIADSMEAHEAEKVPGQQREEAFKIMQQRLQNYFGAAVKCTRKLLHPCGEHITIFLPVADAMVPRFASEYIDQV
jgi:LytS/YehU family sensor histidine kinase